MPKSKHLPNQKTKNSLYGRREILWTLVFIAIAAASIWAITTQIRDFSLPEFWSYLRGTSSVWIILAAACMLAHIFFEGSAILLICRAFGYGRKPSHGFVYASADIYFSAITPSATGGQPASAFFMIRDGIPGTVSTVALLVNLVMYTLSILVIGLFCFLVRPGIYTRFSPLSRGMILVGCTVQCFLALGFLLLLKKDRLVYRICSSVLRMLSKLHLIHNQEYRQQQLLRSIEDYRRNVGLVSGQWNILLQALVLNLMQRAALICVTMCSFRATGGARNLMLDAWIIQGFSIMGYNFVPIPGAMGVADLLLLDGFGQMMSRQSAVNLELLSRFISFYGCILICGLTIIARYFIRKARKTVA